jgi:hypothetical protein
MTATAATYCTPSRRSDRDWFGSTTSRLRGSGARRSSKSSEGTCSTVTTAYAAATIRRSTAPRRPLGNARRTCPAIAGNSASSAMPKVNSTASFDALINAANQAKPAAVIRAPVRFSGRRHHAARPVPVNDHPTRRPSAASTPRWWTWPLRRTSTRETAPARTAAHARAHSAQRRDGTTPEADGGGARRGIAGIVIAALGGGPRCIQSRCSTR